MNAVVSAACSPSRRTPCLSGMGRDKVRDHMATGAEYITGADSSCLMHMQGVIDHDKLPIRTIHAVEILNSKL